MTKSNKNSKPVATRLVRNLKRVAKDILPPVISKLFKTRIQEHKPVTTDDQIGMQNDVEFLLPVADANQIWPNFDQTEVTMLPRHLRNHLWAMPENELLVLAAICKVLKPKNVFEFGTFTGGSTLAMAANTEEDAKIVTLDIDPAERRTHRTGVGSDIPFDYQIGESFIGTRWEQKIVSVHCEATNFDPMPYAGSMDLVFVDADHTYSFASSDTQKAFQMLSPNGVILWHDYRWDDDAPECAGVTRCVNEFHQQHQRCTEISGTRFAVFDRNRLQSENQNLNGDYSHSDQQTEVAA